MKNLFAAVTVALAGFATPSFAADPPACEKQATEKKLAGAARTSFMKKCERDAMEANPAYGACDKSAAEKKLAGAAKTSHMKKCIADAGAPAAATPAKPATAATPATPATPAAPAASGAKK